MAAFTIQSVVERPNLDPAGQIRNMTVIYLRTQRGATGSLEIPSSDFEALTMTDDGKQTLRDIFQQKADSLDAPFEM